MKNIIKLFFIILSTLLLNACGLRNNGLNLSNNENCTFKIDMNQDRATMHTPKTVSPTTDVSASVAP